MKSISYSFILLVLVVGTLQCLPKKGSPMDSCFELIVVTTSDWNSSQATLRRYARPNIRAPWRQIGEPITVMVGKSGLAWGKGAISVDAQVGKADDPIKKEGDGRAPAGVFYLTKIFGYPTQPLPGWKMPYQSLNSSVECVDDVKSKFYNRIVDRSTVAPDWSSSEHMLRQDDLYRWGVLVDHNPAPEPGAGSCIFMHIWRGPGQPTVGCTAMPQADLESLIAWLDPARTPVLVQLPIDEYTKLREGWRWPKVIDAPRNGSKSLGTH
jgi:L,D-peptidoglycan transpeptidase YkuD (ErfK/YbiS/YcfS/YnhG family)